MGTRRWFVVGAFILLFGLTAGCANAPAGAAPTEGGRVRWEGTVEAVLPNGLRVNGQEIRLNGQTVLEGEIRPGMSVVIEGQMVNGAFLARSVRPQGAAPVGGRALSPLPTPTPGPGVRIEFEGTVEAILPEGYQIAGHTVLVTTTTHIEGNVQVGAFVQVEGFLQPNGTVLAREIEVKAPKPTPSGPKIEFQGTVEALLPNGYQIAGHTVLVTTTTHIEGNVQVGAFVQVEGFLQPNGTVLAREIEAKTKSDTGDRDKSDDPSREEGKKSKSKDDRHNDEHKDGEHED